MDKKEESIIIIGGGPAGIAAGIQLRRCGLDPLLLERHELGGLLWNANLVENYPGFPNGVSGVKLAQLMKKQVERLGVNFSQEEVQLVDWERDHFLVTTRGAARAPREARTLLIASGTRSCPLPEVVSPGARDRVFTEVRQISGEEGKRIIIVGAGDAAFDYALNLSKKRNFVTILNRGEAVKCLPLLFERASKEPSIQYMPGMSVSRVQADKDTGRLEVRVKTAQGRESSFPADYILFAIGRVPCQDFLSAELLRREQELHAAGRLYWIGDVRNGIFRQAAIAAGDGLRAAMEIYARCAQ